MPVINMPKTLPDKPEEIVKLFPSNFGIELNGNTLLKFREFDAAMIVFKTLEMSKHTSKVTVERGSDGNVVKAEFGITMNATELVNWLAGVPRLTAEDMEKAKAVKSPAMKR